MLDTMSNVERDLAHRWTFRLKIATITFDRNPCCGGGFSQEYGQPYSLVSDCIKQVDIVLEDEGQQYGNMGKPLLLRVLRAAWEIWSGDHRQPADRRGQDVPPQTA